MTDAFNHPSEESIVKYGGLSNEELILVFHRLKRSYDNIEENLAKNQISKNINTPMGKGVAIIGITPEQVEKFRESDYYKLTKSVVEKLSPLVELVTECDENLKKLSDELR